jgi:hypothetical protein
MAKNVDTYRVDLECPYGRAVIFRRSGVTRKDWEYLCQKFGINQLPPEKVQSITIEGEDDYGHLLISIVAER